MNTTSQQYVSPEQVIFNFYAHQDRKQFQDAFDCMTPELQNINVWKGDVNAFAKGYAYTTQITNVACEQVADDIGITRFKVTYDDHINQLHHPLTDKLNAIGADDPEAASLIAQFNAFMVDDVGAKPEALNSIARERYFGNNNAEVCLYLAKANYIGRDELFTFTPAMSEQTRMITVIDTHAGPRISSIRPPAPHSA